MGCSGGYAGALPWSHFALNGINEKTSAAADHKADLVLVVEVNRQRDIVPAYGPQFNQTTARAVSVGPDAPVRICRSHVQIERFRYHRNNP